MVVCCISFDSYIKPQLLSVFAWRFPVVYILTPTSNHNLSVLFPLLILLYIFWLLHQTTTWFDWHLFWCLLYIFWLLHQTTTTSLITFGLTSCISFDSYIKPQLYFLCVDKIRVVYLLTPTSNHNWFAWLFWCSQLYIFWLLHQTTTISTQE